MILHHIDAQGAFLCGDTETGRTAYAYPSSPAATEATRKPQTVAARMLAFERPREILAKIAAGCRPDRYDAMLAQFRASDERHMATLLGAERADAA